MGQAHARLGAPDPRLTLNNLDFRLGSLLQSWKKDDPPPQRVKPLPLPVLSQVWTIAQGEDTPLTSAAASCLIAGFFFLLRPGEYLGNPFRRGSQIFRLCDLQFWISSRALDLFTCPEPDLRASTFVTLTFTQQKNGVRNKRSRHTSLCPVQALVDRALALRAQGATPDTTINAVRPAPGAAFKYLSGRF